MDRIPDNYDMYCIYQDEQDRWLEKLPVCSVCGEPIQDDFLFDVDDELYCEECMIDTFRKSREDYEQ